MVRAAGELREGASLDIVVSRQGTKDRKMTVTVTDVEPERRLAWVGRLGIPALFEGRHVFELEALAGERTRLTNLETVSGILAGSVTTDEPARDYEAMNQALKERVEAGATAQID